MKVRKTFGNNILIKLDKLNDSIRLKDGLLLYIDTTFDPEKHATVTGEVIALPSRLQYTGKPNKGMPWKNNLEVKIGDRVVMYYLSVTNCFRPETYKAIIEGEDRYVFIQYQNILAFVRDDQIVPTNGYCLVEPVENPEWVRVKERMEKVGLQAVRLSEKSNTDVVYARVKYCGRPNDEYVDDKHCDQGVDVSPGDIVVMRRISDIPLEYDLHAKIDGGKKYWRVQRRNILAIYEKSI